MRDLTPNNLQFDEIWGFISKEKHRQIEDDSTLGDVWTFCAIDAETKLVPAYKGKRDHRTANAFVDDVASRLKNRPQISSSDAIHVETVPVKEIFQDQVVWEGDVEVFDLTETEEPTRVYAWAHDTDRHDETRRTVTILDVPPVTSPELAVRASIVRDYREREENH